MTNKKTGWFIVFTLLTVAVICVCAYLMPRPDTYRGETEANHVYTFKYNGHAYMAISSSEQAHLNTVHDPDCGLCRSNLVNLIKETIHE